MQSSMEQTRSAKFEAQQKQKRKRTAILIVSILLFILIAASALTIAQTVYGIPIFPTFGTETDTDISDPNSLPVGAEFDKNLALILNQADQIPEDLRKLYVRNTETFDFVINYPNRKQYEQNAALTQEEIDSAYPFFLQWDKRWGYTEYCEGFFANTACGPTCLSMVIVGLTHNSAATPRKIADYSEQHGYSIPGTGTAWALMTAGAKAYGIQSKEISLSKSAMVQELQLGHPIICSMKPGDFTQAGHFIVIYAYEDGVFRVHDPNSIVRSEKTWDYDTLKGQISNLWSFSKK